MSEQNISRSSSHKPYETKHIEIEKMNKDKLLKDMINISLAELNTNERNNRSNIELEVRFGTKGIKRIDKMDFDNVIKKLKSIGFSTNDKKYLLRAYPEYIDPVTGINKVSSVRLEINGIDMIQTYCKTNSLKDIMYTSEFVQKSTYKKKGGELVLPIEYNDFNFRITLNNENKLGNNSPLKNELIDKWSDIKKTFRYIHRLVFSKHDSPFNIDLSIVKRSHRGVLQDNYIKKGYQKGRQIEIPEYTISESEVFDDEPIYEIEIEMISELLYRYSSDELFKLLKQTIKYILSGLQQTNYPISYIEQSDVLNQYIILVKGKDYNPAMRIFPKDFIGPSSTTLQILNLLPINEDANYPNIRRNYTVTDKADGDRKLLFIDRYRKVYLIDTNMRVQFTGCTSGILENVIIDGEHILHDKHGNFINLYAAFDIYILDGKDKRTLEFISLKPDMIKANYRLPLLDSVIKNILLKSIVKSDTNAPLRLVCKTFYTDSERQNIFQGCKTILQKVNDDLFEYNTDGLVFTPMNKGVGLDNENDQVKNMKVTWIHSFKWKPPEFNTIDFLVSIKKGPNGEDLISNLFKSGLDMSTNEQLDQYKTLLLRVGFDPKKHGYLNPCEDIYQDNLPSYGNIDDDDGYKPVRFYPTNPYDPEASICNILMKYDSTGNKKIMTEDDEVIEDNMIVEFKYIETRDKLWRWVPLRIRYEKTAELRIGMKNYGNAYHVANDNWHSIHYPVTKDMITTGENIPNELGDDDVYYNKTTNVSKTRGLRDFHNLFVKRLLISKITKAGDTLIDYAVGKGGDIPKWIASNLSFVFGIDISRDNIENKIDGICARYLNYRKKFKIMPSGLFVNGNSSVNIRNTNAIYTDKGKQITKAVFGEGEKDEKILGKGVYKQFGKAKDGFNISSIQFALHYMFENNLTLQHFLRNVSECTKLGGYFIATSYDGETIFRGLANKSPGESIVINQDGTKIWEVKKIYDNITFDDDITSLGYAIDVYQETINKVFREYLVNFNYLTRLMENYGFVQITDTEAKQLGVPSSSGMFSDLYNIMEQEINRNRSKQTDYGLADKMSPEEKRISFLNRYFIYKKVRIVDAESIANTLLDTSKQIEKEIDMESKKIENEIKKKSKTLRVIRKLNKKVILTMEDDNDYGVEESKGDADEDLQQQEANIETIEKTMAQLKIANKKEEIINIENIEKTMEHLKISNKKEETVYPLVQVPLIKKKGRPKKLVIQQQDEQQADLNLQIETIHPYVQEQEQDTKKEVKKRGRPKKI